MSSRLVKLVPRAVADSCAPHSRVVLAISGGLDSMVLLDAAAAVADAKRLVIATFDHGTGDASRAACDLVQHAARDRGLECVVGRARRGSLRRSEASWRDARWAFLRDVARDQSASIATAHTADDQIETVLMRVLRDAGPRGIAGLLAASGVLRPLLGFRRTEMHQYAIDRGVAWVEDPTNASSRFLRNRLRHDILPALRRANPAIDDVLLDLGRRAAQWRRETDAVAKVVSEVDEDARAVDVIVGVVRELDIELLAVVWPAVAARVGATLDHRGIRRVSSFSRRSRIGSRIQLAGGWEVVRSRHALRLHLSTGDEPSAIEAVLDPARSTSWGRWTFSPGGPPVSRGADEQSEWNAVLPIDGSLRVREWRPGDRLMSRSGGTGRKVKRLLNDAGVTGHERNGWPVVLWGDRIVWVPGVRRSDAATMRSGGDRPRLTFSCARHSG